MPSLLGIDNGLTVTKAVAFDIDGTQLSVARRRVPQSMPHPRWVERDMIGLWRATAEAIAEAVGSSGRSAADIEAVAATAHGDGVYLINRDLCPLGAGILSLDSRAGDVVARWARDGVCEEALTLTDKFRTSPPRPLSSLGSSETIRAVTGRSEPCLHARIGCASA